MKGEAGPRRLIISFSIPGCWQAWRYFSPSGVFIGLCVANRMGVFVRPETSLIPSALGVKAFLAQMTSGNGVGDCLLGHSEEHFQATFRQLPFCKEATTTLTSITRVFLQA